MAPDASASGVHHAAGLLLFWLGQDIDAREMAPATLTFITQTPVHLSKTAWFPFGNDAVASVQNQAFPSRARLAIMRESRTETANGGWPTGTAQTS
jgi:hypothetical protein